MLVLNAWRDEVERFFDFHEKDSDMNRIEEYTLAFLWFRQHEYVYLLALAIMLVQVSYEGYKI